MKQKKKFKFENKLGNVGLETTLLLHGIALILLRVHIRYFLYAYKIRSLI